MALVELPKGHYVNEPPNSFSSGDLLRIIAKNTTKMERIHVAYFFLVVFPATGFVTDLIEIISLLFKPTKTIMKILKLFRVWDMIVRRINPFDAASLLMLLPEEPRIQARKLLTVLENDFFLTE